MSQLGKCRSCNRPIRWVVSGDTGRHVAIEAEPSQDGDVFVDRNGNARTTAVKLYGPILPDNPRYRVHKCNGGQP